MLTYSTLLNMLNNIKYDIDYNIKTDNENLRFGAFGDRTDLKIIMIYK